MKYNLKVKTRNEMFIVNGKPVRSPFIIENLNEDELNRYLFDIRTKGLTENDYEITNKDGVVYKRKNEKEDETKEEEVSIEELKSNSTLDSIMKENK